MQNNLISTRNEPKRSDFETLQRVQKAISNIGRRCLLDSCTKSHSSSFKEYQYTKDKLKYGDK